jgi:hypothetical protein
MYRRTRWALLHTGVAVTGELYTITTLSIPEHRFDDISSDKKTVDYCLAHVPLYHIAYRLNLLDAPMGKEYLIKRLYLVGVDGPLLPIGRTVWKEAYEMITNVRDVQAA